LVDSFSPKLSGKQEPSGLYGVIFLNHSMIEIQEKTFSLFQRAVAARRLILFPSVEKDFNSNGKKQTRPESSPASTLHVSGSVSFYRFRYHRSFRKNLRRTMRFE
jgi:hypothetical protein